MDRRRQPVPLGRRTIAALGGHEFSRKRGNEAIRDHLIALADPARPKICLLPTASGDPAQQIGAFRGFFAERACELSHLSLFRREAERVAVAEHLLSRDLIYVGGGSMLNLLAIWRAHGLDRILRRAWESGIVLCGQSAGAMCWFEAGVSLSAGSVALVEGLGFVPGVLSVHYHRDAERRRALLEAVASRRGLGYGVDDAAGLIVRGDRVAAAFSGRDGAGAWRAEPGAAGKAVEVDLQPARLRDPRPALDAMAEDVNEMRRVRGARAGVSATWPRR